jgi:hypothetical protein
VKHMRSQSGWGWDHVNHVPDVPLGVWESYVAVSIYIPPKHVDSSINTEVPESQGISDKAIPSFR